MCVCVCVCVFVCDNSFHPTGLTANQQLSWFFALKKQVKISLGTIQSTISRITFHFKKMSFHPPSLVHHSPTCGSR